MSVLTDNTAKLRQILEKVENLPEIPESVAQATPTISVSSGGLITATATQEAGAVAAGTKSATHQLTTKGGTTITPGTSDQTINSGVYLTGNQTIKGDANLKAENIANGVSIFGIIGNLSAGSEVVYGEVTGTSSGITVATGFPCRGFFFYNTSNANIYGEFLDGTGSYHSTNSTKALNKQDNANGSTFSATGVNFSGGKYRYVAIS